MTAPTWTVLPADAPEPPPLSVVREGESGPAADRCWVRTDSGWWRVNGMTSGPASWSEMQDHGPLALATPAVVVMASRTAAVEPYDEWPGDFDVRAEALRCATRRRSGLAADNAMDVRAAGVYERYLRGDENA